MSPDSSYPFSEWPGPEAPIDEGPAPDAEALTQLLNEWSHGSADAEARLFAAIYPHLHNIAANRLRDERASATLQTTDLVHEAYLALLQQRTEWQSRVQFYAIAARLIRRLLIDRARSKGRDKRGARAEHVSIDSVHVVADDEDLLIVHRALIELTLIDERAAKLVELRYFGGLSLDDAAVVLGCGRSTAVRTWRFARAWLKQYVANAPS
jgi:RNA polymerase sigma-70 factor, ECF subfamily